MNVPVGLPGPDEPRPSPAARFGAKFGMRLEELDALVVRVTFWRNGLPHAGITRPVLEIGVVYDDTCWQQRIRIHSLLIEAERFFADDFQLVWATDTLHLPDTPSA